MVWAIVFCAQRTCFHLFLQPVGLWVVFFLTFVQTTHQLISTLNLLEHLHQDSVFTWISEPRTACPIFRNKSVCILDPSLLKYACGLTLTFIIRSPGGPPWPAWPFFDTLRLTPLSTPFGTLIVSFACSCVEPRPLQVIHGDRMTWPTPSQFPHTC